jgi:Cytochrome P450
MTLPPIPKTPTWLLRQQLATNPLRCMDAIYKRYGDIVSIMSGSTPIVYVSNPLGIKQIFSNTKEITDSGMFFRDSTLTVGQQGILQIEPKEFKPERFLEKKFSPYEFFPFGGGARSCIAGAFSLFQMKLVLATILSRYKLALVSKRPERQKLFDNQCRPKSGVKMVMQGRRIHEGQSQPLVSSPV